MVKKAPKPLKISKYEIKRTIGKGSMVRLISYLEILLGLGDALTMPSGIQRGDKLLVNAIKSAVT